MYYILKFHKKITHLNSESQMTISNDKIIITLATPVKSGYNLSNYNLQLLTNYSKDPNIRTNEILKSLEGKYNAYIKLLCKN